MSTRGGLADAFKLNEYDKEMERRGVPVIRYADDIVVLSKSKRAAERLLETTQRYLEGKLKLKMNEDSDAISGNNGRTPGKEQRVSFNWTYQNGRRGQ